MKKKDPNVYPKGWNRKRVEDVIAYYDMQIEAEAIAEADAAWENSRMTAMRIPNELVGKVRALLALHRPANGTRKKAIRRKAG